MLLYSITPQSPQWRRKSNGNKREDETYRDISLLNHTGQTYAKQRVRRTANLQLDSSQFGSRSGSRCIDALLTIRKLGARTTEYYKNLYYLTATEKCLAE